MPFVFSAEQERPAASVKQSLNEKATAAAWESFNGGKYQAAITNAMFCIDEFKGAADRLEAKLEKEKPDLPTGTVSEEIKKKIFQNGLLNDVATCFFVKGRAEEKLGKTEDAAKTYTSVKAYSYARTWDPSGGWFWSPSEAASDRLATLSK